MKTRAEIEAHLRAVIDRATAAIERIDIGTDPDLPDEPLRSFVRGKHVITIKAASKVLAAYYTTEDLV